MKTIHISGATGYLGSKLCGYYLQKGYLIKALIRSESESESKLTHKHKSQYLDFPDRFRFKPPGNSVSKAAIITYTECCTNLYASSNFRFNTVAPGFVDQGQDSKFISRFDERLSIQRFAKMDEVVHPIEFLFSDEARYITGTTVIVDGGYASR
jgi:hypothetical protein